MTSSAIGGRKEMSNRMAPTTKLAHIEESNSPGSRRLMEQEVDETESIKHNGFSGTTLDFPTDTPFQYEYAMEKFYVRACYGRYYDVILEMFEETGTKRKRGVTVTGTPGIGKSMFMAYFFLRYLFEYDNSTVILASYDGDSELTRVLVWKDGQVKDSFRGNVLRLEGTYAQYPHALVLLDGPPKFGPEHQQYVVFTSPNEKWFRKTNKLSSHKKIYMPLWEADELTEAVNVLGLRDRFEPLDLGDESPRPSDNRRSKMEEVYRFDVFDGVAHACFSVSADVVTDQHDLLKEAIDVAGTMDQGAMAQEMFHRVFHYDVSNDISST